MPKITTDKQYSEDGVTIMTTTVETEFIPTDVLISRLDIIAEAKAQQDVGAQDINNDLAEIDNVVQMGLSNKIT